MLRRMVPIAKLVKENCDSRALGTRIRNILQEYEELEEWEDRLKEYLGNEIIRAEGYWKGVLQRALDIVLRIDNIQFPYHYGSYATINGEFRRVEINCRFHTTMVLTQPRILKQNTALVYMFPYHYGSYATSNVEVARKGAIQQFPYHYGSYATYCRALG